MKQKSSFRTPIIFSVLLHIVIFALLFMHLSHPTEAPVAEPNIVKAFTVNPTPAPTATEVAPPVVEPPSLAASKIRQIEQTTLKQPELSNPAPKPQEKKPVVVKTAKPVLKKIEATPLESPRPITKKIEPKRQQEEEIMNQHRAEEVAQLEKELSVEAKTATSTASESKEADDSKSTEAPTSASAQKSTAGDIDRYKQQIVASISRKWLMPETDNPDLTCKLLVRLGPGGIVLSVEVLQPSGDANLDRSANNAIMKASPLPVPENSELFDNFRSLRLTFKPQGIVSE